MMSMKIGDMTSSLDVVKAFDEVGEALLGKSADDMKALQDNNPQEFENVFTERHFTMWVMKIRSKETTFREESKLERQVQDCKRLDHTNFREEALKSVKDVFEMCNFKN